MNTPFGNSVTTAEHAIALMFALAKRHSRRPTPRRKRANGKRTASWAWRSRARRSASLAAATSARCRDARLGPEDARDRFRSLSLHASAPGARRRESGNRRSSGPRRLHNAAYAAHPADAQHSSPGEPRQDRRRACASSIARGAGSSTRKPCARRLTTAMSPARR